MRKLYKILKIEFLVYKSRNLKSPGLPIFAGKSYIGDFISVIKRSFNRKILIIYKIET